MEKEIKEKTCENCRFYNQHYVKIRFCFSKTNCGYCVKNKFKKKKSPDETCGEWENISVKKAQRKKSIQRLIESMCEYLEDISVLLKDDTEN